MIKEDIEKVLSTFMADGMFTLGGKIHGDAFQIRDRVLEVLYKDKMILIAESFANIENLLSEARTHMSLLETEFNRV